MEEKSGRLLLAVVSPNFLMNNILALKNIHAKFFPFMFFSPLPCVTLHIRNLCLVMMALKKE